MKNQGKKKCKTYSHLWYDGTRVPESTFGIRIRIRNPTMNNEVDRNIRTTNAQWMNIQILDVKILTLE
jgi:hypothetical protein